MASLSVYFARLLRVYNAKLTALAMKGGKTKYEAVKMSLFVAETEAFIGFNLDSTWKLDLLDIEDHERKKAKKASDNERDGMEEFMAIIKECVGANTKCKNLIRKMHSGLQMLNSIRAVFVVTSQSRLQ
jgi:hypothetical protein